MGARMKIAVIGAGAWGTGLAIVLGRKGTHQVRLWAYENDVRESIVASRGEYSHFCLDALCRRPCQLLVLWKKR